MPETTPLIKAALNLRVGAGFDVYQDLTFTRKITYLVATPPSPCGINKAGTGYQNPAPALAIVIIYFSNN